MHEIPQITVDTEPENDQIVLNLNDYLWLHQRMEEYQKSHMRLLPSIDVHTPSKIIGFAYPRVEGVDIVYYHKDKIKLVTTFK